MLFSHSLIHGLNYETERLRTRFLLALKKHSTLWHVLLSYLKSASQMPDTKEQMSGNTCIADVTLFQIRVYVKLCRRETHTAGCRVCYEAESQNAPLLCVNHFL